MVKKAMTFVRVLTAIGVTVTQSGAASAELQAKFLGVTTILLDDGETAIMTDGFFSRPGLQEALFKIAPNEARIEDALQRAGVARLAAVMTAHSHHDHAMDAPIVATRTGAVLIGSESTANIARGLNFPEDRLRLIRGGETFTFGRFSVTAIKSPHTPKGLFRRGDHRAAKSPGLDLELPGRWQLLFFDRARWQAHPH
jgi:L-ascorbate metabolism protein UlaG (beta-lactamase superfamily)